MQKRYLATKRDKKIYLTTNGKARILHIIPRVAAYLTLHGRELERAMDCASKGTSLVTALSDSPSKPTVKARLSASNDRMADLIAEHEQELAVKDAVIKEQKQTIRGLKN